MKEPITIIGAGPAGLTSAIVLRRHGFAVRVYEKAPDVGHRLNGDYQGLENWSSERDVRNMLMDMGIEITFPFVPYHGGIIFAPGMKPVEITSERPVFYLVKRGSVSGSMDMGLKEQALSLGVEILFNRRIDSFEGTAIVGTGPRGADTVAAGMTFSTSTENIAAMILDDTYAPGGYAYLLCHQGHGTMVTVLYREFRKANEYFGKVLKFFRDTVCPEVRNERKFCCYGNFFLRDSQVRSGKLYVGEAGGFQDCLWGFGMRYAFLSGYLAARSFIDRLDYDMLWKRELRPMLETSLVNRYLFEMFGHAGYRYLARKFAAGHPCGFLRRHYNYSFLKHLLLPAARRKYTSRVKGDDCMDETLRSAGCTGRGK